MYLLFNYTTLEGLELYEKQEVLDLMESDDHISLVNCRLVFTCTGEGGEGVFDLVK